MSRSKRVSFPSMRVFIGVAVLFTVLQVSASALNSMRGEFGVFVALLVVAAAIGVERTLHARDWHKLGLGTPTLAGVEVCLALSVAMICGAILFRRFSNAPLHIEANAGWLMIGIFAQGGFAEEVIFRGYLFGHVRQSQPFWRATVISAIPFTFVHLALLFTLPLPIGLAAIAMALALTPPFARLYELGGRTIWAPALLHGVIQAVPKLVTLDQAFPFAWMLGGVCVAWLIFLVPPNASAVVTHSDMSEEAAGLQREIRQRVRTQSRGAHSKPVSLKGQAKGDLDG